jgi:hypothetical protein
MESQSASRTASSSATNQAAKRKSTKPTKERELRFLFKFRFGLFNHAFLSRVVSFMWLVIADPIERPETRQNVTNLRSNFKSKNSTKKPNMTRAWQKKLT